MTDIPIPPEALEAVNARLEARVGELEAENERLLAANKDSMLHFDALKADHEKMRAAGQALVAFYEGPLEAKRPDVFHRLMVRLNAALSPDVRERE